MGWSYHVKLYYIIPYLPIITWSLLPPNSSPAGAIHQQRPRPVPPQFSQIYFKDCCSKILYRLADLADSSQQCQNTGGTYTKQIGKLHDTVNLRLTHFEVTHKVLLATDGDVRRLTHVVAAVKPADEVTSLRDTEHCRRDAVDCDNVP